MKVTHPYANTFKGTEVPATLASYVEAFSPPKGFLVKVEAPKRKTYWEPMATKAGLEFPVPPGTYVDPDHEAAEGYLLGAYEAMGGAPVTRHLLAVALGFHSADEVDRVRDRLIAAGRIDPGSKGRSSRALVPQAEAATA